MQTAPATIAWEECEGRAAPDESEFFSPHAAGKSVMFLVALGRSDRAALGLRP